MPLEEFIGDPYMDLGEMREKFKRKADESGLPFTGSGMIYNTRRAQELRAWVHEEHGAGEAFEKAVFAAYFVDDKNLARTDVLLGIVRALGLPEDEAREVLSTRRYRRHVESDLHKAHELKIMSPPSFLANGNRLVGTQPFDVLLAFAQGKK
jgi:predicted DsbA family dithiol-disulfide isomerase